MGKGVRYSLSPTGKLLAVVLALGVIAATAWTIQRSVSNPAYYTCAQLYKIGKVSIKRGDPLYQASLDRNHDGIACN